MTLRPLLAAALLAPAAALAAGPAPVPSHDPAPPAGSGAARVEQERAARARAGRLPPAARVRAAAPAGARVVPVATTPRLRAVPAVSRASRVEPRPGAPGAEAPRSRLEAGLLGGHEAGTASGLAARVDGAAPVAALGRSGRVSAVVSAGYARLGARIGLLDLRADVWKLVPAARLSSAWGARLALFGEVGFGVAYVAARLSSRAPGLVAVTAPRDRSLDAMARVGVGASYRVDPRLDLALVAGLDPILGDFAYRGAAAQSTFQVLGGVVVRL